MEGQRTHYPEVLREHGLFREPFLLLEVQAEGSIASCAVRQFHSNEDVRPVFLSLLWCRLQDVVRGGLSQRCRCPCDERHDARPAPSDGNPLALTPMFCLSESDTFYLYPYPTDMRKSFYTLSGIVTNEMQAEAEVLVRFTVDKTGFVRSPIVVETNSQTPLVTAETAKAAKEGDEEAIEVTKNYYDAVEALKEEAIHVVRNMPRWEPGRQNGKRIDTSFTLPVSFKLDKP